MAKKKMSITTKVLIGLLIGLITGIIVYNLPSGVFKDKILINGIFQLLGQVFLRGIMMLVVPLVFVSLVNGTASIGDVKKLGRVGAKTIAFYLVTTAVAIILALILGYFFKPGVGIDLSAVEVVEPTINERTSVVQILYEMVPTNPISAMANGSMLQIIVFAIITGVGISLLGPKAEFVQKLFVSLNDLIMKLVEIVMLFAPIGVFGLVAKTFATVGYRLMIPLMKYIILVYVGLIIHAVVVYGTLLKRFAKLS
ncbi:MAG TPA: cation:dicarboxylase symporter family transporter, partial [Tissierellaceae bacterium]